MKLHNLCLDRNIDVTMRRYHEDIREGDLWQVNDNIQEDDAELRGRSTGYHRKIITAMLQQHGILRPMHASMNSRC
jgi:hypothetical protein